MNKHTVPILYRAKRRKKYRVRLEMTLKEFMVFVGLCAYSVLALWLYSMVMP